MSLDPQGSDIYSIGWWIESADDDTYGPASRATLVRFLAEGVISPNTLVRHCTEATKRPAIDVPGVREAVSTGASFLAHGDKLSETWPRRTKERLALAQDALPCAWKNRPAVLVCLRCGAPYCEKYRAKPFKRQFFFCRRCQSKVYNRRIGALIVDSFFLYVVTFVVAFLVGFSLGRAGLVTSKAALNIVGYGVGFVFALGFVFRDSLFGSSGPGKRVVGLRVVRTTDGQTPVGYGQAFLRWLAMSIPVFGLFDVSAPYRDPLMRRYGDRWAGTRVIDTESRIKLVRDQILRRLRKKGIQLLNPVQTPMSTFARTDG
jgi:uncharacterized RDD family membrane protein YckC